MNVTQDETTAMWMPPVSTTPAASPAHVIQDLLEMEQSVKEQQVVKESLVTLMLCVNFAWQNPGAFVFLVLLEMDLYVFAMMKWLQLFSNVTVWMMIFVALMLIVNTMMQSEVFDVCVSQGTVEMERLVTQLLHKKAVRQLGIAHHMVCVQEQKMALNVSVS